MWCIKGHNHIGVHACVMFVNIELREILAHEIIVVMDVFCCCF
jgi:hypothetical protein